MIKKSFHLPQEFLDHLNFDNSAKQIELLKDIIFSPLEKNQAKIEFLKAELAADRYQVDNRTVASRLLEYVKLIPEIA